MPQDHVNPAVGFGVTWKDQLWSIFFAKGKVDLEYWQDRFLQFMAGNLNYNEYLVGQHNYPRDSHYHQFMWKQGRLDGTWWSAMPMPYPHLGWFAEDFTDGTAWFVDVRRLV